MAASNTFECFRECIGKTVVGVMKDALPIGRADLNRGTRTLVFDDGTGITFSSNGSYWQESVRDIERAIDIRKSELNALTRDVEDVLTTAGAIPAPSA